MQPKAIKVKRVQCNVVLMVEAAVELDPYNFVKVVICAISSSSLRPHLSLAEG